MRAEALAQKKRISKASLILGGIFTIAVLLKFILTREFGQVSRGLKTMASMLAPDFTFESLNIVIFAGLRPPGAIPFISLAFLVLFFTALFYFNRTGKGTLLLVSYVILIISIALSIQPMIVYFNEAMERYRNLPPTPIDGLEGMMVDFSRYKPSITLLILHLCILAVYIIAAAWIIRLLKKENYKSLRYP